MATPLRLRTDRREDGTVVLTAVGELDLSNIAEFSAAIGEAVGDRVDGATLQLDFSSVDYLDSAAINVLFEHADTIDVVANPILMPVLTVSGLTNVVTVKPAGSD
ncbi:anti-anti-sigma factor [Mycolicibacterium chubuense]|jgi:anti-anti-sigma factor|uniref:STAS domain protein n=1 Tax=Mycolicibacterium chubuense TaxID=1800 RepID=A0A0J6WMY8_MYCCU|nr:STAS domain-containing protein [Mycolicibacterium chubuense]KMO83052.1 STAS domain protein [Mycolicibacterium chubuense]ORA49007.1 anti-anti-sigma factor [Mycolicibacterium chubuense]SPY00737.1 anti-sigma-factor antagonist [Mycolicibacterium chubuense]